MRRLAYTAVVLLGLTPTARAEPLVAYYEASWASLPAGHLVASLDDNAAAYRDTLTMDTAGLPHLLLHFHARVDSAGEFGDDGLARPERYGVDYDLRKYHDQHIRVAYVARDGAVIAERTAGDTNRKPVLPENYRRNVVDPLAAFATVRRYLMRHGAKPGDRFTLPVFDDVRRFNVAVSVVSAGGAGKLVNVHLDLVAVAGFRKKDDKRAAEEAPRPIELTFRDDGAMTPTQLEISVAWLPLIVRFDHACADMAHCAAEKK